MLSEAAKASARARMDTWQSVVGITCDKGKPQREKVTVVCPSNILLLHDVTEFNSAFIDRRQELVSRDV